MEDMLYTGSAPNIAELITMCHFPAEAFVLLECFPQYIITQQGRDGLLRFAHLGDVKEDDLNNSTSGRVFQQNYELRWEKNGNEYRITYLGKEPEHELPGLKRGDAILNGLKRSDDLKRYYLFGEWLDDPRLRRLGIEKEASYDYYAEVRIPRLLRYPIKQQARRVRLVVREYVDEATGRVQLFRFQDLEPE